MSSIEWTEETWNPIVGCSVVSPGCTNCYAMRLAGNRLDGNPNTPHYAGTTKRSKAGPVWTGKVAQAPEKTLQKPLTWRKPRRVFVNSMGDLFHEDVPDEWIDRVFAVMALAPQHTFQVLTKRADRMRAYVNETIDWRGKHVDRWLGAAVPHPAGSAKLIELYDGAWLITPLPNVWLGVSAEDQRRLNERVYDLVATPAAVRFISAEPLINELSLRWLPAFPESGQNYALSSTGNTDHLDGARKIDWIIVGGESGPGARDMNPDWARSIRDQCTEAGVSFFMKQMARKAPIPEDLMIRQYPAASENGGGS